MFWSVLFGVLGALAIWSMRHAILGVLDWSLGALFFVIGKTWPLLLVVTILAATWALVALNQ
jgi:hypothetical protein